MQQQMWFLYVKVNREINVLGKQSTVKTILAVLETFKPVLEIQNIPFDAAALLPLFSEMAHHNQTPPTSGAMSLGVSVLFFL